MRNLPANVGDTSSIPESGGSSGVGNGNLLQHSHLENLLGRGAWQAAVRSAAESDMTEGVELAHVWLFRV